MQEAQSVLVILLSIGFIILIVLTSLILFVFYKVLTNIRRITSRLDETTENLGEMTKYMGRKLGPAAASAVTAVFWRTLKSSMKRDKGEKK